MNIRIVTTVFAAFLLSGCSFWERATTYVGVGPTPQSEPASEPAAQAAPDGAQPAEPPVAAAQPRSDTWCQQIAKSASIEAADNGFDSATQRRRAESTYRQCVGSPSR